MGVQVVPAFSVFQTPPDPAATYQTALRVGWITMSLIRPDMMAGPMLRNASPDKTSAVTSFAGSAAGSTFPAVADGAFAARGVTTGLVPCAQPPTDNTRMANAVPRTRRFITTSLPTCP
jgi:hypothetical protein